MYLSHYLKGFERVHHHHHDVRLARISLTLSLHVSLSVIASGRSSALHPVSTHSCCMNVPACRPVFDWPYARVTKGFYCVRGELEAKQNCNILTPTLMAITAFLSSSPGLLNRGGWGPSLSGSCSSFQHLLSNCNCSIFSSTATAGCWFSLLHRISNWLNFLCTDLYNNLTSTLLPASVTISHSIQPIHGQGYILIFLDRMHLLFTQVHFLFWQLGRVNMLHFLVYARFTIAPQHVSSSLLEGLWDGR